MNVGLLESLLSIVRLSRPRPTLSSFFARRQWIWEFQAWTAGGHRAFFYVAGKQHNTMSHKTLYIAATSYSHCHYVAAIPL